MADGYKLDAASIEQLREDHRILHGDTPAQLQRRLVTHPPMGGGASSRPYIITETDGNVPAGNVAVYRYCGLTDLKAKAAKGTAPLEAIGNEVDVNVHFMHGVSFTGQCVFVQKVNGSKEIVNGWLNCFFRGACVDAIAAGDSGTVNLTYVDYLDDTQVAPVEALNTLDRALSVDQVVYVWYGTTLTGEGFYIQSAECPT